MTFTEYVSRALSDLRHSWRDAELKVELRKGKRVAITYGTVYAVLNPQTQVVVGRIETEDGYPSFIPGVGSRYGDPDIGGLLFRASLIEGHRQEFNGALSHIDQTVYKLQEKWKAIDARKGRVPANAA